MNLQQRIVVTNRPNRMHIMLFTISVLLIMMLNGCNYFTKATVTKGNITFSFEYPQTYKDVADTLEDRSVTTELVKLGVPNNYPLTTLYEPELTIFVVKGYETALQRINDKLDSIQRNPLYSEFTLVKQAILEIDSVVAEYAEFEINTKQIGPYSIGRKRVCWLYFNRDDMEWSVELVSPNESASQAINDIKHVVKTFRIISE